MPQKKSIRDEKVRSFKSVKKKRHNGHMMKKKSRKIETLVVQSVCNNCNRSLGGKALFPSLAGLPKVA